jgi:hypothetical protein
MDASPVHPPLDAARCAFVNCHARMLETPM